jgi:type IV pilus assembly protein PilM
MIKIPVQISKFFPKKERFIGLDMGRSSIKLAEFAQQAGKLSLRRLKLQEIDLQKDAQPAQLDALKDLFAGIDTKEAKINVVVNSARSTTRILTIPYMPKSEIPHALQWEMKKFISFSVDEAVLDYEILQEVLQGGVKKLKVAIACSPQKTINEYLGLLNQAGIQPDLFTQPGFALKNIIATLIPKKNQTIAVLDIGCTFSELFIFQGKELAFSRKMPVAGQNFTQGMSQALVSDLGKTQLSPQEAEGIKRKYGIPDSGSSGLLEGKITSNQLLSLLRPNLEKLATELERSFDFYREKEHGSRVEGLILLGGGSNLKNLAKILAESLNIPVELGSPLTGLHLSGPSLLKDTAEAGHRFASGLGAALSPAGGVNLLPVEIKEQTKVLVKRSSLKALVTAVIVISILSYIGMKIRLRVDGQRIAATRLQLSALAPHIEGVQKQAVLVGVLGGRIYCGDVLKEIGNRIPHEIRLTTMDLQQKRLSLKGEIRSVGKAFEEVLSEFMDSLEKGIFKEANLVSTKKGLSLSSPSTFELSLTFE